MCPECNSELDARRHTAHRCIASTKRTIPNGGCHGRQALPVDVVDPRALFQQVRSRFKPLHQRVPRRQLALLREVYQRRVAEYVLTKATQGRWAGSWVDIHTTFCEKQPPQTRRVVPSTVSAKTTARRSGANTHIYTGQTDGVANMLIATAAAAVTSCAPSSAHTM